MVTQHLPPATSGFAGLRSKLSFLAGSLHLILVWPVAVLIVSAVAWYFMLSVLEDDKHAARANALHAAQAFAHSYADEIGHSLQDIDRTVRHIRYDWVISHGNVRWTPAQGVDLLPGPLVDYAAIIDRQGHPITATQAVPGGIDFSHSPAFQQQQNAESDGLHIGRPTDDPVTGRKVVYLSRRLANDQGQFDGIVLLAASPAYFTKIYNESILGVHGYIGLLGDDGILRAERIGPHAAFSTGLSSTPVLTPYAEGSAVLAGRDWFGDRRTRYIGWEAVKGYPLIAVTGLDEQAVFVPYWERYRRFIQAAILATAIVSLFGLIAMAMSMRLAWHRHQMRRLQSTYRMATEGGNEGFYICRPIRDNDAIVDFEIVDCNHVGAELLYHRREEIIGRSISAIYGTASPEQLLGILRDAEVSGAFEGEIEVPGESPVAMQWARLKVMRSGIDLAVTLQDISAAKAHIAELERRTNEDVLTGLPNRHWVQNHLPQAIEHARANAEMLALLFIDLDGFKAVNDTMGHAAGDEVLRSAARRLKDAVRPHDIVARLAGDEFVVLLENIVEKADAAHVAERIMQAFQNEFRLSRGTHSLGTSIGISLFPEDGNTADALLQSADIAMYSVKTSGKRNFRFYDERFYEELRARRAQEADLRYAVEHDQFVMHYQPRIDVATGMVSSMESLVRWAHPTRGLVPPGEFIELAEETGLIQSLGRLVIDKVCAQLAQWEKTGKLIVPVSINVSYRQFNETDLAGVLSDAISRHGLDPHLVELELTESSMMEDGQKTAASLDAIQQMGVRLLVDDFGTGYSSLSKLQRLDVDVLKVDQAFTAELGKSREGSVLFKAIITMAHALDIRVVAEGVETKEQIGILKALECDELQGFYFSRPLPPAEALFFSSHPAFLPTA